MRELKNIESKKSIDPLHLSNEMILQLGEQLDDVEMLHIEKLYFTANGDYYTTVHPYEGTNKTFKGKKYARFKKIWIETKKNDQSEYKYSLEPILQYEIVAEYESEYLVDQYLKLLKKNK